MLRDALGGGRREEVKDPNDQLLAYSFLEAGRRESSTGVG